MNLKVTNFKIFLVDDQSITNIISKKLIEVSGLCKNVYDFTNPKEALDSIYEHQPDLILLDLNMPNIDGWQFLERLNSTQHKSKIIILTSSTSVFDKEKAKNYCNVIDFYSKPLNLENTISILNRFNSIKT
ncbi:response regulator [Algibacter sp. L1A34]|uniref:response regulator n=1 Tax=Algibacter sp. L1A34 TaxID=2686365 RepID=UPI00131EC17E|nr:response regulator [Algibacter sp. L1A34]